MNLIELVVTRTMPATAEELFDAWIDPSSPGGPWFGAKRTILNPVVDGLFYSAVEHEGRTWPHYGRFIRLQRPHHIEHTWVSEATQGVESVIDLTLDVQGDETRITLRHRGVPDDEMGRRHEAGWTWVLSMLEDSFKTAQTPGTATKLN